MFSAYIYIYRPLGMIASSFYRQTVKHTANERDKKCRVQGKQKMETNGESSVIEYFTPPLRIVHPMK